MLTGIDKIVDIWFLIAIGKTGYKCVRVLLVRLGTSSRLVTMVTMVMTREAWNGFVRLQISGSVSVSWVLPGLIYGKNR